MERSTPPRKSRKGAFRNNTILEILFPETYFRIIDNFREIFGKSNYYFWKGKIGVTFTENERIGKCSS